MPAITIERYRRLAGRHGAKLLIATSIALPLIVAASLQLTDHWRIRSIQLTMTAGSAEGLRHSVAESLAKFAERRHVDVHLQASAGSGEALQLVNSGELDMALVQGGLAHDGLLNVQQAAVLYVEPLHLLVKVPRDDGAALPDRLSLTAASQLLQTLPEVSINVGTDGSGTAALATDLLNFFGLAAGDDYEALHLPYAELLRPDAKTGDLPDLVFTVSSLPSPVAKHLIDHHGFRPVELAVSDAFRLDWHGDGLSSAANGRPQQEVLRKSVVEATIPAFTYQVSPPVPREPLRTLGARLQLVVHRQTPPAVVERVVDAVYGTNFANVSEPMLTIDLLRTAPEFELHAGATEYLKKKTPLITEHVVEVTEQLLAICGALCGGILFVWQAMAFARRRRRDRQFLSCIERVGEIEQRAMQYECDELMDIDDLVGLQQELTEIRRGMVKQFQDGAIDGADTLSGFLMHVNDANENLTRMILHERAPRPRHAT